LPELSSKTFKIGTFYGQQGTQHITLYSVANIFRLHLITHRTIRLMGYIRVSTNLIKQISRRFQEGF